MRIDFAIVVGRTRRYTPLFLSLFLFPAPPPLPIFLFFSFYRGLSYERGITLDVDTYRAILCEAPSCRNEAREKEGERKTAGISDMVFIKTGIDSWLHDRWREGSRVELKIARE